MTALLPSTAVELLVGYDVPLRSSMTPARQSSKSARRSGDLAHLLADLDMVGEDVLAGPIWVTPISTHARRYETGQSCITPNSASHRWLRIVSLIPNRSFKMALSSTLSARGRLNLPFSS